MAPDSRFLRSVPVVAKNHNRDLMQALHKQRQSGYLCDVWLVIENERFAAHKAVLASFSSYFNALFENGQKSDTAGSKACNVKEIVLSSVDKCTFLPILHFVYTSRLHVFKENISDILRTARKLQISSIVEICNMLIGDKVILPTLNDLNQLLSKSATELDKRARSNILYVDLSDCGDTEEMTAGLSSEIIPIVAQDSAISSNLADVPMNHIDNWGLGSQATTSSKSAILNSSQVGSRNVEHLQVRSIYSIATSLKNRKTPGFVTTASSLPTAVSPSYFSLQDVTHLAQPAKNGHNATAHLACSHCGKVFSKKANLKRHILIKHSSGHQYSCPKCGKTYAIEQSLQYHMSLSKCSKTSLISLLDDFVPLAAAQPQTVLSVSSSIDLTNLGSPSSPTPATHSSQRTLTSSDVSPGTSFLHSSLASSTGDYAMSLGNTLFPSIANLGEPSGFERLDTSYKLLQESNNQHSHSTPMQQQDHNTNSDDDMPTISRVQSMSEPFLEGGVESFSHVTISGEMEDSVEQSPDDMRQATQQEEENLIVQEGATSTVSTTGSDDQMICHPDTTTSNCTGTSVNVPNLIRIVPKTPMMASLKRHSDQRSMVSHQDKFPVLLQNPVDVSALAGFFQLPSSVAISGLQYSQPASTSFHHFPSHFVPSIQASIASSTATTYVDPNQIQIPRCPVCSRIFPSMDALNVHKRRCCKCPFCNRVFSQYSNMRRHVDIFHTKQKPHKCGVCGRAYGIQQSLRIHMQTKHGIPYVTRKYNRNRQPKVD